MAHFEKKIDSKEVFRGKIISVNHDTVVLENGRQTLREVVCHPGAVVILARDEEKNIYLVRQYRYCLGQELLEVPAGKMEAGEDHREAALRELREETGMTCSGLVYMGEVYPSPGVYNEVFHMYFASGLIKGEQQPDEDEFLTLEKMSLSEFDGLVAEGRLPDAKSICIVAMARARGLI